MVRSSFAEDAFERRIIRVTPAGEASVLTTAQKLVEAESIVMSRYVEMIGDEWGGSIVLRAGVFDLLRVSPNGTIESLAEFRSNDLRDLVGVERCDPMDISCENILIGEYVAFGNDRVLFREGTTGSLVTYDKSGTFTLLISGEDFEARAGALGNIDLLTATKTTEAYGVSLLGVVRIGQTGDVFPIVTEAEILGALPPLKNPPRLAKSLVHPSSGDIYFLVDDSDDALHSPRFVVRVDADGSGSRLAFDLNQFENLITVGGKQDDGIGIADLEFLTKDGEVSLYFHHNAFGSIYRIDNGNPELRVSNASLAGELGLRLEDVFMSGNVGLIPIDGSGFVVWNALTKDFYLIE